MNARLLTSLTTSLIGVVALWYLGQVLWVGVNDLLYPFELEWMEGGTVDHLRAIFAGEPIYREPSLEFVSYIYGPVYFYLSAFVALFTGTDFFAPRLVSFLSSLGMFWVLFAWVRRETDSSFYGLLAVGLLAGTFQMGGSWYALARVDTLFMFLTAWSAYILCYKTCPRERLFAIVLMVAAVWTKQTALFVSIVLFAGLWLHYGKSFTKWVVLYFGLVLASYLALQWWSNGWMGYHLFEMPSSHPIHTPRLYRYWTHDIFLNLPVVTFMCVAGLALVLKSLRPSNLFTWAAALPLWFWFCWGLVGGTWPSRMHTGGWDNTIIPAFFAVALASTILLHKFEQQLGEGKARWLYVAACSLVLAQLAALYWSPSTEMASAKDRQAGEQMLEKLSAIDGEIWMPAHTFVLSYIDKPTHANGMALWDIIRQPDSEIGEQLYNEVEQAIREQRFAAIVPGYGEDYVRHFPSFKKYYRFEAKLFDDDYVFWTVRGYGSRPEAIWVPIEPAPE